MAKSPSIRLLIECLLVAVLGFGIWQLYFKTDNKKPPHGDTENGRAMKSSRFIKDKARPEPGLSRAEFSSPPARPRENVAPLPAAPEPDPNSDADIPELAKEGILAGVIVDEDGNPLTGPITVSDSGQTFSLDTFDGEFREALPPGSYTVTARGADGDTTSAPVVAEIKEGETQSIQLVLPVLRLGDIGLEFQKRDAWIEVLAVWNGGPAQQAGIQPGDLIIEIGGSPVRSLDPNAIAEIMAGPAGSQVEVVMAVAEADDWVDVPVTLTRAVLSR